MNCATGQNVHTYKIVIKTTITTAKIPPCYSFAGKLVDVFMGRHGGTSSIVYYMCALQGKDLCKPTRWAAEQVSHFSDNAVRVVPL